MYFLRRDSAESFGIKSHLVAQHSALARSNNAAPRLAHVRARLIAGLLEDPVEVIFYLGLQIKFPASQLLVRSHDSDKPGEVQQVQVGVTQSEAPQLGLREDILVSVDKSRSTCRYSSPH